jgi:hypothetical protein
MADTPAKRFYKEAETFLEKTARLHGFAFSLGPLHASQGAGRLFALNGHLDGAGGSKWFALIVWAKEAWADFEQCHLWWYFNDRAIVPHRPSGIPQFPEVIRGIDELRRTLPERLKWAADTEFSQMLMEAVAGRLLAPHIQREPLDDGGATPWDPPDEEERS